MGYQQLIQLFKIIDQGDAELEVPRYNGGLFYFSEEDIDFGSNFKANHFLLNLLAIAFGRAIVAE